MVTTFFGPHSFGGDAAYVDRLARALLRRGHEVDVVYDVDAFEAVRGDHPLRAYEAPPGLHIHPLRTGYGPLSSMWTHQTGRLGPKGRLIRALLAGQDFDVLHFHNISLVGGPELLTLKDRRHQAVKLMTAHEHWLVCPLSLLWKLDREVCEEPTCMRCTLAARRPVQLWRYTSMLQRALKHLDALIFPSRHTLDLHRERGPEASFVHLPYFLPDDVAALGRLPAPEPAGRPYFVLAGRLVKEKGFDLPIRFMADLPNVDLLVAGTGPYGDVLRRLAVGLPNVRFLGLLDYASLARLYRGARALIVPSLFYETFGYVVLEAFSAQTPAIVHDRGALPELIARSGGGFTYRTDDELLEAMRRLAEDPALSQQLGQRGYQAYEAYWNENTHMIRYLELIERIQTRRRAG